MAGSLEGKVAIVTGAARGIGLSIAMRFVREGARVVIDDVDDARGEQAAAALVAGGGQAIYMHANVADQREVATLVQQAEKRYGPVDILVNNALAPARHVLGNDWDPVIDICLKGPWLCMQAVLPGMIARGGGSIVNISSVNALAGFGGEHVYTAAKAGLLGMSRSMAVRYGPRGVRINVICPGTVVTEAWTPMLERDPGIHAQLTTLYPMGRLGRPDDIAGAALYLAGPDAAWTTGSVLVVDGGVTAGYTAFTVWDE